MVEDAPCFNDLNNKQAVEFCSRWQALAITLAVTMLWQTSRLVSPFKRGLGTTAVDPLVIKHLAQMVLAISYSYDWLLEVLCFIFLQGSCLYAFGKHMHCRSHI